MSHFPFLRLKTATVWLVSFYVIFFFFFASLQLLSVTLHEHCLMHLVSKHACRQHIGYIWEKREAVKIDYSSQVKSGEKVKKHTEKKKAQTKFRWKLRCRLTHLTRLKQEMQFPNKTQYSKIWNILCNKGLSIQ